ncbi:cyclopropane-fatty-acyl-phospholipid synthase [Pedobacter ginsengisoli]|uniref:Cyclopropane-fatty-acyl-phospholipid synthase n=1 Tax=Pedobacter ginsengisoli TaxID=363852 RepID=A0A2D1U3M5_9SPHI|nr:cyclopropane fatty acyl phospholipid synthase [Pedobacter ginsengisoli]ATP56188.1 cyclopropane-fatty-acyl-phospholipid synthase [Pedobacter ginsengisoli]
MNKYQATIEELILPAGIHLNGTEAFDIQVYDDRFYNHVLRYGSLGLGESYMNGWWDCLALDHFLFQLLNIDIEKQISKSLKVRWQTLKAYLFNMQTIAKSVSVAHEHYDLGNDLFEAMLDKHMMYSCGYWEKAKTLDEAQEDKLELICRKLKLTQGMEVLDIGCGWGGFAQYASEKYQVKVTGVTISSQQAEMARHRCYGLSVDILLQDYRLLTGYYDRIVSIGMFEHVGYKNYRTYMQLVKNCLKDDGIFLLHCIGGNENNINTDAWINKYIFPGGMIPSVEQLGKSIDQLLILQDWHNFGLYYDRTLMEWLNRFRASWGNLKYSYSERFYRMWEYYLSLSAASFRARKNHLWQIILTKPSFSQLYQSVR